MCDSHIYIYIYRSLQQLLELKYSSVYSMYYCNAAMVVDHLLKKIVKRKILF